MDLAAIPWADLAPFIVIGFLAQLVDSALGMAFGVISSSLLVMIGIPPVAASATTHTVEGFTSGTSGLAHALRGNVDWPLFTRLVIPGIVGGLLGVWLVGMISTEIARPVMLVYLVVIGVYLIWRAPRRPQTYRRMRGVGPLALIGGIFDVSGGGGWGPIVTGNLLAQGMTPRIVVGTVNAAEFFVTVTVLSAFIGNFGPALFTIAASGLLLGGIVAAPAGAWLTGRISPQLLLKLVGTVLIIISFWGFLALMFEPTAIYSRF